MSDSDHGASFFEHLSELRTVFFKILICVVVLFPVCYVYVTPTLEWFISTTCPPGLELKYFAPMEPFFVEMKLALIMALYIGFPFIAYQIWSFVAPGLYANERYAISRFAFASWFFFALGSYFSLKFIFPLVLKFSMGFQSEFIKANIGVQNFVSMATMMTVGFGLMFQFPIAVFLLVRTGLVDVATMRKHRPVVVIGILVLSAILTPPDVVSQLMMGIPTYILFEGSLLFAQFARLKALEKKELEGDDHELEQDEELEDNVPQTRIETAAGSEVEVFSDDDDFDDDYDPDYDDEGWDYEEYERSEKLKKRKAELRRKKCVRRIRGNG